MPSTTSTYIQSGIYCHKDLSSSVNIAYLVETPKKPIASGRPRIARRRDVDEGPKKSIANCCGAHGHNSKSCRGPGSTVPRVTRTRATTPSSSTHPKKTRARGHATASAPNTMPSSSSQPRQNRTRETAATGSSKSMPSSSSQPKQDMGGTSAHGTTLQASSTLATSLNQQYAQESATAAMVSD